MSSNLSDTEILSSRWSRGNKQEVRLGTTEFPTAHCPWILFFFSSLFSFVFFFLPPTIKPALSGLWDQLWLKVWRLLRTQWQGHWHPGALCHSTEFVSLPTFSNPDFAVPWGLALSLSSFLDLFQGYTWLSEKLCWKQEEWLSAVFIVYFQHRR